MPRWSVIKPQRRKALVFPLRVLIRPPGTLRDCSKQRPPTLSLYSKEKEADGETTYENEGALRAQSDFLVTAKQKSRVVLSSWIVIDFIWRRTRFFAVSTLTRRDNQDEISLQQGQRKEWKRENVVHHAHNRKGDYSRYRRVLQTEVPRSISSVLFG